MYCYSLHGHLGHNIKCGEVCTGKTVFVLAHLDGIQPLIHGAETGEIRDAAVQEREMNTKEDKNKFIKMSHTAYSRTNFFQKGSWHKPFFFLNEVTWR